MHSNDTLEIMYNIPNLEIESKYEGKIIAGIDEAGRGPLAGPVVAAAVIIDQGNMINGINDSKKLNAKYRELLYKQITENYKWSVGIVQPQEIDEINILQATIKACYIAEKMLNTKTGIKADIVLVDGNMKFDDIRFKSIIKGDNKSISIAAGSIVAKVTRDRIMQNLAKTYSLYGWEKNFGYGTAKHMQAIADYGLTIWHRKSFKLKGISDNGKLA